MAIAAIETRKATLRRKFIEAPEIIVRRSRSLQIFPRALTRRGNLFGVGFLAELIRWTQIPGDGRFVVEAFCLEEQRLQIWIANLSNVLDFYMAQVVALALEKFARILHGSAARKAERDMLLSEAKVAKRAIPFKNGDAPGFMASWQTAPFFSPGRGGSPSHGQVRDFRGPHRDQ